MKLIEEIGIRGNANELLKSYLTNRTQVTKINGAISDERVIKCGVPQGTVLGPILFLLYVNNLYENSNGGKIISYADDTVIIYRGKTWTEVKQKAEEGFTKLLKWFHNHLLTINYEKTKYMSFSYHKNMQPSFRKLKIETQPQQIEIDNTNNIKYLGIHLDCHLRWDIQADKLNAKLRKLLYKFKILSQVLSTKQITTVYYALAQALLQYGILGCGTIHKVYYTPIEILQKRLLKIMFKKSRYYSSSALYEETKILDPRQILLKKVLIFHHQNLNSSSKIDHQYNTRMKVLGKYNTKRATKSIGMRSLTHMGTRLHNTLPAEIRNINNIKKFRSKIITWIYNQGREFVHRIIENAHTLNI